jgi:hypothetical protein
LSWQRLKKKSASRRPSSFLILAVSYGVMVQKKKCSGKKAFQIEIVRRVKVSAG